MGLALFLMSFNVGLFPSPRFAALRESYIHHKSWVHYRYTSLSHSSCPQPPSPHPLIVSGLEPQPATICLYRIPQNDKNSPNTTNSYNPTQHTYVTHLTYDKQGTKYTLIHTHQHNYINMHKNTFFTFGLSYLSQKNTSKKHQYTILKYKLL